MKKLDITKKDIAPIALLAFSLALLTVGIILKSLIVVAGVAGLLTAWFLCIDTLLANHKMNIIKRIFFGSIIIFVPVMFALYLGA